MVICCVQDVRDVFSKMYGCVIVQYMAEWIELWDLEAMTSYNREIGVHSPVGTSRLEFFHPGFTPKVFLH